MQAPRHVVPGRSPAARTPTPCRTTPWRLIRINAICTLPIPTAFCTVGFSFWANSPEGEGAGFGGASGARRVGDGAPQAKSARFSSTQARRRETPSSGVIFGAQPSMVCAFRMSEM